LRAQRTLTPAASAAAVTVQPCSTTRRASSRRPLQLRAAAGRAPPDRIAVIAKLRRLRMTAAEIAETLQMPLSTVSGILTQIGVGRLDRLGLEPAVRYERSKPGELVHIDVKKLERIVGGAGWRVRGGPQHYNRTFTDKHRLKRRTVGYEYVHAVDVVDCPRFGGQRVGQTASNSPGRTGAQQDRPAVYGGNLQRHLAPGAVGVLAAESAWLAIEPPAADRSIVAAAEPPAAAPAVSRRRPRRRRRSPRATRDQPAASRFRRTRPGDALDCFDRVAIPIRELRAAAVAHDDRFAVPAHRAGASRRV
jgi:hypothetical protein